MAKPSLLELLQATIAYITRQTDDRLYLTGKIYPRSPDLGERFELVPENWTGGFERESRP
jgi:hypothetical protein